MNLFLKSIPKSVAFNFQIIMRLQIKPKLRRGSEIPAKPQGCIGRYCPHTVHDFVDAARGYSNIFRQAVLTDPHWDQKLFLKNFPGMNSWKTLFHVYHLNDNLQFQH